MKGFKIIFMLTLVVVIAAVGVFFVEDFTTPVIEANLQAEIEAALVKVYPAIEGSGYSVEDSTKDFGTSGVIGALEVKDGDTVMAVIYTVEFTGFASQIKYLVGVDASGNITGYQTLAQNDTAGYGAQIADSVNWTQFVGMSIETAGNGDFDGLAGASVTTGKWKDSFSSLFTFHADNYPIQPLSDEQKALNKVAQLAPDGTTISAFDGDIAFADYDIDFVFVANDGTEDVMVLFYDLFEGPYGENEVILSIDLATDSVVEFKALSSGDTPEFGGQITDSAIWEQLDAKTTTELINGDFDGISGSTLTTDAWKTSMQQISIWYEAEILGNIVLTPEEQFEAHKEALFAEAAFFTDVTLEKPANSNVAQIFDAYNQNSEYLGTVYYVTVLGPNEGTPTFIQFLVGIDKNDEFTGFKLFSSTVKNTDLSALYETTVGDELIGVAIDTEATLTTIVGLENILAQLNSGISIIADYHQTDYFSRPDSVVVDTQELTAAFPTAATFESVYENYDYSSSIGNIYAAKDSSDTILGYVYYGMVDGNNGDIFITFGIDLSGQTEQLNVWGSAESWADAEEYGSYNGNYGTSFLSSTWLALFEDVTVQSLVDSPVDSVSGVTNTTGPLSDLLEAIANYHIDNSVGGAN
jgi:Na+-translocating ferredoxin:NAD+ oxidoreductase RnfG subunit